MHAASSKVAVDVRLYLDLRLSIHTVLEDLDEYNSYLEPAFL